MKQRNFWRRTGAWMLSLAMMLSLVVIPAGAAETVELKVGDEQQLQVDLQDGETVVRWESTNPDIASVSDTGVVKGISAGIATVTATITSPVETPDPDPDPNPGGGGDIENQPDTQSDTQTHTVEFSVTVSEADPPTPPEPQPVEVESITMSAALTMEIGEKKTLTVSYTPENATEGKELVWSSSATAVATVDRSGVVTAVSGGEATITVVTENGKQATCKVTVNAAPQPIRNITLRETQIVEKGDTVTISAAIEPSNAKPTAANPIQWSVTVGRNMPSGLKASDIVTLTPSVDGSTCKIAGVAAGEVQITASWRSNSNSNTVVSNACTVTVPGVVQQQKSYTLYLNESMTLNIIAVGMGNGNPTKTWESKDNTVVQCSSGNLRGVKLGKTIVTVTVTPKQGGKSYTAEYEITVAENTNLIANITNARAGIAVPLSQILTRLNEMSRNATATTNQDGTTTLGYGLDRIENMSVSPSQGILYYNYISEANPGMGVGNEAYYYTTSTGTVRRMIKDVYFVPRGTFSGTATISFRGQDGNGKSFDGTIRVSVAGIDDVRYTTISGNAVAFQVSDFNTVCSVRTGRNLSSVTFTLPNSSQGTLYYNFTGQVQYAETVRPGTKYLRSGSPNLGSISFLPTDTFSGTVSIPYYATDVNGGTYNGTVTITVNDRNNGGAGEIRYSAAPGERVTFQASDFNSACQSVLGQSLDYVRFTLPASREGTLYYNYRSNSSNNSLVYEGDRYYRSGNSYLISNVTFVPASSSLDRVSISYTGYSGSRTFTGTVTIIYSGDGVIPYTSRLGRAVEFESADFTSLCQRVNGRTLSYVRFNDLPSSTQGTLYYNYSSNTGTGNSVVASTNRSNGTSLYVNGSPSLSRVAFVPRNGYTGTVNLGFTGYDANGYSFTGTVRITVEAGAGDATVRYNVRSGGTVNFNAENFNEASRSATGANLSYVSFTLPAANRGTLYYNNGQSSTQAAANTNYYRTSGARLLNNVSYTAPRDFNGTVEISYRGTNVNGQSFTGLVQIQVTVPTAETLQYSGSNSPIPFQAAAFRQACNTALGEELSYIQFTSLPAASAGRLYANYSGSGTGNQVSTGTSYYYSGTPGIDQLSFVPTGSYQGTVTLAYTAVGVNGERASGTVSITLSASTNSSFNDMGNHKWAIPAVEYLYQQGVVNGVGNGGFGPNKPIKRGDFVLMICRAFDFSSSRSSSFTDVPTDKYYAWAVAAAEDLGIVNGSGGGRFTPESSLTRQDAMLMLYRAMTADGWSLNGVAADLSGFADNGRVSDYARNAVAAMVQLGIVNGSGGNLNPRASITRAEMATMLYRVMTL